MASLQLFDCLVRCTSFTHFSRNTKMAFLLDLLYITFEYPISWKLKKTDFFSVFTQDNFITFDMVDIDMLVEIKWGKLVSFENSTFD